MNYEELVAKELKTILKVENISFETPKDKQFGDFAYPCFLLSKQRRQSPVIIAKELEEKYNKTKAAATVKASANGPYLNFKIQDNKFVPDTIRDILSKKNLIKKTSKKSKVLVESPGPNTNKPLHLGHLRNILLGKTISKLLETVGKEVHIVNVINDRGIHICKSMLAYKKWGEGKTPESENIKGDHFVGNWYVKFAQEASKSKESKEQLESEAKEMLLKWEAGDKKTLKLWETMNSWVYDGFEKTYKELNFDVEKNYYESETYKGGKEFILQGLKEKKFYKDETGAVIFDLEDKKLGKKVLLRSDGTSVYITQDINMANLRYQEYKFDEMIYVVGNEQEYHFKVLFEMFKILNWPFGEKCQHFSYGMIELPEGKMKSREGNVLDTDDLIDNMKELAKEAIKERYNNLNEKEIIKRADIIAKGAAYFFFLKNDPVKNFVFDPKKSLAFEGETGPYVQYTHARICSILRKAKSEKEDLSLLIEDEEINIVKDLKKFQEIVEKASIKLKPNLVCHYLLSLSQSVNSYYSKYKVIQDNKALQGARCRLLESVKKTISQGLNLLDIKAPERM